MEKKPEGLSGHIVSPDKYSLQKISGAPTGEVEKTKTEFDDFKKKVLKKYPFTIALTILPANSYKLFEEDEGLLPEEIERKPTHILFLIPEDEYKNIPKIKPEIIKLIQESKQNIWVHIKTPVDLWNYGLDSKYEFIDAISAGYPLHDTGLMGALRVASIHKTLVLRKFEKYVASYVIAGSLVRGTADKDSDVDVFIVIDDTDVKKMPRLQLLEKLRSIIYDYIREATALAGVKNILNVQVYLLTDFWQSVKDAHPVMFTFIRDGVPLYDRGTFLPWQLLLKMGKIKPSPEAVDMFMKASDQTDSLVKRRLIDAMIDIYWGVVTPTQALMMLAGEAPPVPKTIVSEVKKAFVDKEKIMGQKELKFLEKVVGMYKDYEHAKLNEVPGKEIDLLIKEAKEYDKKLKEMRKKLEGRIVVHNAEAMQEEVFSLLKNIFGNKNRQELISSFDKQMVKKGKMPVRFVKVVKEVAGIKQKASSKKLNHSEVERVRRDASELVNSLTELIQRRDIGVLEKGIAKITYKNNVAELLFSELGVFLTGMEGIRKIEKGKLVRSDKTELESALASIKSASLTPELISLLKKELGDFTIEFQ